MNAPEKIFADPHSAVMNQSSMLTFHSRQHDTDVEYTRSDLCETQWFYPEKGELPESMQEIWLVSNLYVKRWVQTGQYVPAWDHSFLGQNGNFTPSEILCWTPRLTPAAPGGNE